VATTMDDSTFHETVKKHAHAHAHAHDLTQKKGHRKDSIHCITRMAFVEVDVELVLLRADLLVGMVSKLCKEGVPDLGEGFCLNILCRCVRV